MFVHLTRRAALLGGAAAALAPAGLVAPPARGQTVPADWPRGRTLRIVVPFAPAGATDVLARLLADALSRSRGANVIVENKPGAGGNIGAEAAARAAPDGDTMMLFSVGMATNGALYPRLSYDPVADFAPVSLVALVPNIMVVGPHVPVTDVKGFIEWGRAKPGGVNYGSSGVGTSLHLSGELFKRLTGLNLTHVPYRGAGPALQDLVGGRIDVMWDNISSALPQARAGQIKGLGITTAKRSPFAPELAPVNDTVPGFDVSSWFAVWYPARVPRPMVEKLSADIRTALGDATLKERLGALAAEAVGSTPDELAAHQKAETEKWGRLIREGGITAG